MRFFIIHRFLLFSGLFDHPRDPGILAVDDKWYFFAINTCRGEPESVVVVGKRLGRG